MNITPCVCSWLHNPVYQAVQPCAVRVVAAVLLIFAVALAVWAVQSMLHHQVSGK